MICANCGHELTGHMKFCSHCGQKQAAGSVAPNPAPAQRPMLQDYHFVLDTAKVNIIIAVVLGVLGVLMFLVILLGAALALFTAENGLVGAIVLLVLGIVFSLPCIIVAIVCATIGYEKITVSGRQISIKRLWGTRTYDCSEIAKIKCGRVFLRYHWVYIINCKFRDGKGFAPATMHGETVFTQAAGYLGHMADVGIISPEVVSPEIRQMLRRYEVKAW